MAFQSLACFISALEGAGELIRIKEYVSPKLEIAEIADRFSKHQGKALLFEKNGSEFPLLINAFGSEKRICMALGVNQLDDIVTDIETLIQTFLSPKETFLGKLKILPRLKEISSFMPHLKNGRGECQEVVMEVPDLTLLPVLTCWPADGGPFITLPCVHTTPPPTSSHKGKDRGRGKSGARNLGMYRMQVFGPDLTGMHWHPQKDSAHHYLTYKQLGKRMPVSVTLGGDPVYTYVATAPLPENIDEYIMAGFLRKKRVELVRCLTNELRVPADADFVIEGYVDPDEDLIREGPFGDHTGFYSLTGYFPRFHVTCITHRKEAVYPATIVGIPPQEDYRLGKATERIFLPFIKMILSPELTGMHMPAEGVFHNLVLVSLEKRYPGQAQKLMNALWGTGQMMFTKLLIALDPEVDLTNYREVARVVSRYADPSERIFFNKGPLDILDHAGREIASGSKMGIDATRGFSSSLSHKEERGASFIKKEKIALRFPEITGINDTLLNEGISIILIAFRKFVPGHCRILARSLREENLISDIRFVVFVDTPVDTEDVAQVVWIAANNIVPARDCFIMEPADGGNCSCLFMDATKKTRELDGFERDWPNAIVMDDDIIRHIDEKWEELGLGPFIPSPSLRYKSLNTSCKALDRP